MLLIIYHPTRTPTPSLTHKPHPQKFKRSPSLPHAAVISLADSQLLQVDRARARRLTAIKVKLRLSANLRARSPTERNHRQRERVGEGRERITCRPPIINDQRSCVRESEWEKDRWLVQ